MPIRYPVAVPDLRGNEERYVVDAIRSSWISSTGPYVERFEREFARMCQARHGVSVCNGTAALHLVMLGLGIGPGDEVIVPSLTFVATGNAVKYVGARPVFADVDPDTWCIDPRDLARCLSPRTRGIIAVHLYGHPADMDAINAFASAHGLWVIEDAAEAHAARYKGRVVGNLARAAVFSFYGNKVLTSGEGGIVTLDDDALAARLRQLRGQGMDPQRRYFFPITGHNFRLTNVASAIACAQIERLDEILAQRRRVVARYRERLSALPGVAAQPIAPWAEATPWLFSAIVDEDRFGCSRDALMAGLAEQGIDSRPFFVPLHRLPPFAPAPGEQAPALPHTEQLARRGISLPTYSMLTNDDVDVICDAIARRQH